MMLEGAFDGGVDNIKPNEEKQNPPKNSPAIRTIGWIIFIPMDKPMAMGNNGIKSPNKRDANISPKIRIVIDIGADINLSRVCTWASHGVIMGETAVAVKNTVIPIKPDIKNSVDKFLLPIKNAKNRNKGIKNPNIITGPFR